MNAQCGIWRDVNIGNIMKTCYFVEVIISNEEVEYRCITTQKPCEYEDFRKCELFRKQYRQSLVLI